jgi:hypothetical protein
MTRLHKRPPTRRAAARTRRITAPSRLAAQVNIANRDVTPDLSSLILYGQA